MQELVHSTAHMGRAEEDDAKMGCRAGRKEIEDAQPASTGSQAELLPAAVTAEPSQQVLPLARSPCHTLLPCSSEKLLTPQLQTGSSLLTWQARCCVLPGQAVPGGKRQA